MNLEKFCIVKRRKQGTSNSFPSLVHRDEGHNSPGQDNYGLPREIPSRAEAVLSLHLTPLQIETIRSGGILSRLNTKTPQAFNLELNYEKDGSIIFNFYLHNLFMLNPKQVCQMMQISRSLLNRMIMEKRIKSYKIGRFRRFFLDDILENLNGGIEEKHDWINIEVA